MENYIYLIALYIVEWLLFFYVWKKFGKACFSPSTYTVAMFIVGTSFCLYCVDAWDIVFLPKTFFVIVSGLLMMIIAEKMVYKHNYGRHIQNVRYFINLPKMIKIGLALYCILATFLYYNEIRKIGLMHAMAIGEAISNVKEDYEMYESQFNPLVRQGYKMVMAIAYCYTYIFVNNYHVCKQKFSAAFWYILPLFCGIGINLISGSRGDMLRLVLLFLFCFFICKWQASNWTKQPIKAIAKVAAPIFLVMLSVFFMARLFVKTDVENQKNIGGPIEYIAYYIGSPIEVFNIHVGDLERGADRNNNATFGSNTLGGVYSLLIGYNVMEKYDLVRPKVGVGFAELGKNANSAGNVDTILAAPYVDFGYFGMCIYIFLVYLAASYYFYRYVLFRANSLRYIKTFILFSFFFYEIEMSFYSDVTYLIISQTGILQFICLLIMLKFLIRPQYLTRLS